MSKVKLAASVTLEMTPIPGGTFLMGSPKDEIGRFSNEGPRHEVALAPFLMGKHLITRAQYQVVMGNNLSCFKGANRPVKQVNWHEAMEFCYRLSQELGQAYTLPSEAQWEYACQAGTTTPFHPNEFGLCNMHGNVLEWCLDHYHDSYEGAPMDGSAWVDAEAEENKPRIIRGGSCLLNPRYCRCAYRSYDYPGNRFNDSGFRVVSVPPKQ